MPLRISFSARPAVDRCSFGLNNVGKGDRGRFAHECKRFEVGGLDCTMINRSSYTQMLQPVNVPGHVVRKVVDRVTCVA